MYGGVMGQPTLQFGAGGEAKQTIDVQKSVVGKIIGKGGETITLVQRKSGAKVTVDQSVPEGQPCKVRLLFVRVCMYVQYVCMEMKPSLIRIFLRRSS